MELQLSWPACFCRFLSLLTLGWLNSDFRILSIFTHSLPSVSLVFHAWLLRFHLCLPFCCSSPSRLAVMMDSSPVLRQQSQNKIRSDFLRWASVWGSFSPPSPGYQTSVLFSAVQNASAAPIIRNCQVLKAGIECPVRFAILFTFCLIR